MEPDTNTHGIALELENMLRASQQVWSDRMEKAVAYAVENRRDGTPYLAGVLHGGGFDPAEHLEEITISLGELETPSEKLEPAVLCDYLTSRYAPETWEGMVVLAFTDKYDTPKLAKGVSEIIGDGDLLNAISTINELKRNTERDRVKVLLVYGLVREGFEMKMVETSTPSGSSLEELKEEDYRDCVKVQDLVDCCRLFLGVPTFPPASDPIDTDYAQIMSMGYMLDIYQNDDKRPVGESDMDPFLESMDVTWEELQEAVVSGEETESLKYAPSLYQFQRQAKWMDEGAFSRLVSDHCRTESVRQALEAASQVSLQDLNNFSQALYEEFGWE